MGVKWTPILFIALCLSGLAVSDPIGKEFALVFMQNYLPSTSMTHLEVFLTGFFSDTQVQVWLPNGSFQKVVSLSYGSIAKVELPADLEILHCSRSNMTIHISSNKDISVSAANEKKSSTSIFLVYPVMDWATEYYTVTPDHGPTGTFSQMAIVNGPVMNRIKVELEGYVQFEDLIYRPGEQLGILLGPWESVQLQSNESLTGTHLVAQEPVGVFSGHSCVDQLIHCNHVCLQLPPVASWGFRFVVPPIEFHRTSNTLYITAASPTFLEIRNSSFLLTKNMLPGDVEKLSMDSSASVEISSAVPIMVSLYGYGGPYNSTSFDVFLIDVPSTKDTCTAYYLFLMPGYSNIVMLVVHNDRTTGLRYNNEQLPHVDWHSLNGTDLLWGLIFINTSGYNIISHLDITFGLYTIGRREMHVFGLPGVCLNKVLQSCKDEDCEGDLCPLVEQHTCYAEYQTCMVWGGAYYRTFSGRHMFQSTHNCTSLLIAYPGMKGEDWPFSVERSPKEEFSLRFRTYGEMVEVTEDLSGRIKLNGELIYLPATLFHGNLRIQQRALSTVISFTFGLRVIIGASGLHLQLLNLYSSKVFGACAEPGSLKLKTHSWISSVDQELCGPANPITSNECGRVNSSSVTQNCYLMANHEIFRACHEKLCPKPFIDSCLHALCTDSDNDTCSALEAYARACAMEGVNLTKWRSIAKCDLQCPPQSRYETCPSSYPSVCLDSQEHFDSLCDINNCFETCVCEEGLQLGMGACVPSDQCGCSWSGGYYPSGAEFLSSDCSMRCQCIGSEGKVDCLPTQGCDIGNSCELVSGSWSCYPRPYLSCFVLGDLNYLAFDGQQHKFPGSCLSKLAGLCSSHPQLEYFELYLEKTNEKGGSNYTKTVLKVYGTTVTISQDEEGHAEVDGHLVSLPFVLNGTQLQIFRSGLNAIVLQTDFGLVVSFDSHNGFLVLRVPFSYANALCGACVAPSDIVPGVQSCESSCTGDCIECDGMENETHQSFNSCGIIKDLQGPFRDCRLHIHTESYFQSCLLSMCQHNGSLAALCQSLGSFVAACQEAGGKVHSWRTEEFCKPTCPDNAQYKLCVSSCPETCNHSLPLPCPLPCKEGCSCKSGYTQIGDICVLHEDCGCLFHGQYLKSGAALLTDDCSEQCTCLSGTMVCKEYSCDSGQLCLVNQGVLGCSTLKSPICWVSNNLRYHSFDGATLDGNVNCSYIMTKVCKMDNLTTEFEVHVRGDLEDATRMYKLKEVQLKVYGYTLSLSTDAQGILINGTAQHNQLDLDNGKISTISHGSSAVVNTDFGLFISLSNSLLSIQIPSNYSGKMCGLCGNANQNAEEDWLDMNGTLSKWLSYPEQGMCDTPVQVFSNDFPNETSQFSNSSKYCVVLVDPEGPFRSCRESVSPADFYENCMMNVLMGGGFNSFICSTIEGYAMMCQLAGSTIYPWRNEFFCPMDCPANSNYTLCKDPCSGTCTDPSGSMPCQSRCSEGCKCDSGFYEDWGRCVSIEDCGCYEQGSYYLKGYVGIDKDCQQNCSCLQFNDWQCEPFSCPSQMTCEVREGVSNCYPKERPNPAEHTECIFRPEMPICTNFITCGFFGASQYETFGKVLFNQPPEENILSVADSCNSDPLYDVTATSDSLGSVEEVMISVYGITIVMNRTLQTWVNGTLIDLPAEPVPGKVWLMANSHEVVLKTDFGLTVLHEGGKHLFIMLPASYLNSTCGLCAGMNMTIEGTKSAGLVVPTQSAGVVAREGIKSFNGTLNSWNCSANNSTDASLCMIVLESDGPFGACHEMLNPYPYYEACLSSLCQNDGDITAVCSSLREYALSCQEQNQTIKLWRNDSFCPFRCPMNSHYSVCVDPCGETCITPNTSCNFICVEGCECDAGLYWQGDECIPIEACGCSANGTYFEQGTVVIEEDCRWKCSCPRYDQWQCEPFTCEPDQICGVWEGIQDCYPKELKTHSEDLQCLLYPEKPDCANYTNCAFIGKLGYISFWNKVVFDLSTSDVISVAHSCVDTSNTGNSTNPFYNISIRFAEGSDRPMEYILLSVYDMDIVVEKSKQYKKFDVWANGMRVNFSSVLIPGKIWLEQSVFVILQTDFGLTVVCDGAEYLYIILPNSFLASTCGPCTESAQVTQNNTVAKTDVPTVGNQSLNDIPITWNCSDLEQTGSRFCGMLLDKDGPFGACHKVLSPSSYFNVCVSYQCDIVGDTSAVCQILQDYSASCQAQNRSIKPWRNDSFCSFDCPVNSHYSVCADLCEASCKAPNGSQSCDMICMEGCECDPGFYRQGDLCIPIQDCGCFANGSYYPQGSVVVENCSQICTCTHHDQWQCNPIPCQSHQNCDVPNGDLSCNLMGTEAPEESLQCIFYPNRSDCAQHIHCAFSSKNGYLSFGQKFGFEHLYWPYVLTLAYSCDMENSIDSTYNVSVTFVDGKEKLMKKVKIEVYETDIVMEKKEQLHVWVNGTAVEIPSILIQGSVWLNQSDHFVILTTDFGLTVQYDGNSFLYIILPESYLNSTCGVCASTENLTDSRNDSTGGNVIPRDAELGGGDQTLNNTQSSGQCNETDSVGAILCEMLLENDGPFGACHEALSPYSYYDMCLSHQCQNGGYFSICQSLHSYMTACQAQNQSIEPWRNDSFCPFVCPNNSHYKICVDPCESTCSQPNRTSCDLVCMEGCECNQGFYEEDGLCLPIEDCGCSVNGSYYPQGYEVIEEGCQQKCSCPRHNDWKCDPFSCQSNETCDWRDGAHHCSPKGFPCPPGSEYSECTPLCDKDCKNKTCLNPCMEGCLCQNGLYWDGKNCVRAEECLGTGKRCTVSSQSIVPWNNTTWSLEADVHYEILRSCEASDKLWLRVVLHTLQSGQRFYVFFGESFITVKSDLEVLVNGETMLPPFTVLPDLLIDYSDYKVTMSLLGEMVAKFSGDGQLMVTVSMDFSSSLCGACAYGILASSNGTDLLDCCRAEDFD